MSSPYPLYLTPKNYCKIRSATRRHQSGHKVTHYHKGKYMLDVSKRPLRYYRQPPLAPSRPCSARPARAAEVGRRIYPGTRARRAARAVCGGVTRAPTPVCQRGLQSPSGRHPPAPPRCFRACPSRLGGAVTTLRPRACVPASGFVSSCVSAAIFVRAALVHSFELCLFPKSHVANSLFPHYFFLFFISRLLVFYSIKTVSTRYRVLTSKWPPSSKTKSSTMRCA